MRAARSTAAEGAVAAPPPLLLPLPPCCSRLLRPGPAGCSALSGSCWRCSGSTEAPAEPGGAVCCRSWSAGSRHCSSCPGEPFDACGSSVCSLGEAADGPPSRRPSQPTIACMECSMLLQAWPLGQNQLKPNGTAACRGGRRACRCSSPPANWSAPHSQLPLDASHSQLGNQRVGSKSLWRSKKAQMPAGWPPQHAACCVSLLPRPAASACCCMHPRRHRAAPPELPAGRLAHQGCQEGVGRRRQEVTDALISISWNTRC